ncbi:MAG: ParA family protein, partial [Phycisphaeraceae bacterium]|nr:ParA family protein [Phycisphaeraceae bacterium]
GVESEMAAATGAGTGQAILRQRCQPLLEQRAFDYVLIDCPPSLGLLTVNALAMVREVIVPMQAHFLALQGLSKLLETVRMVRSGINPRLRVSGVVLCVHDAQTILAQEVESDLQAFFEESRTQPVAWRHAQVFHPAVRRNIKLAESPSFGQTIFNYEPDSAGAQDYAALAETIEATGEPLSPEQAPEPAAAPADESTTDRAELQAHEDQTPEPAESDHDGSVGQSESLP